MASVEELKRQNAGPTEAAAKSYRQTLSLAPNDAEAHHGLGMALEDLGQREAALMHLERAVELDGDDEAYRLSLAEARREKKKKKKKRKA